MRSTANPVLQVSVSQLKCFLKCPEQYRLRYVMGVEAAFLPVALAFGLALHKALAAFYGLIKATGAAPELERLKQVFADAWHREATGPVPLQADEDDVVGEQLDKGITMLGVFHQAAVSAPLPEVEAIEHSFLVDVFDPETGEVLEEKLNGVIDLVLREDGHRTIVEHKSSARKYTRDQLAHDFQPTAYAFAGQQLGWGEDIGLRYQVLTKTKAPALQVEEVIRDDQAVDDFLKTVVGVLRAIDAGAFFPNQKLGVQGLSVRARLQQALAMNQKKIVSLTGELGELRRALQAALLLSDGLDHDQLATEEDVRRAPGAISAVLELVLLRLRDLARVISGDLDPALFWAGHNAADEKPNPSDDPDVRFAERAQKRKK